jgi:DNA-binding MarR family transcriptional regulator
MPGTREELISSINFELRRSQNRTDAYDEAVADAIGLNRTDQRCLDIIDQEGGATAGQLAALMGLTTGAITTVLDRLERAGFAQRVRDDTDRRRVHVTLTEKAHKELGPFYEPLMRMSEQLYARYTDEELGLLLRFLEEAAELHEGVFAELRGRLHPGASSTV